MLVVTTSVPGSGKDMFADRFKVYSEDRGKKVKIYDPGEMLFEDAQNRRVPMTKKYVLNTPRNTINSLRGIGIERISSEISDLLDQGCTIMTTLHAKWYWKYAYHSAFDPHLLATLNADIYINLLNNIDAVAETLKQRPQWRQLFRKDRPEWYAREKILDWQSTEFEDTQNWASIYRKPFFTIPSQTNPSVLYRLIYEPWRKMYYVGMPLTLLHKPEYADAKRLIDEFVAWLECYVIVIDPRYVEPLGEKALVENDEALDNSVVTRDLVYLIPQCRDGMIAYSPVNVVSVGMAIELKTVHEENKETNLIYPPSSLSPFYTPYSEYRYRDVEEFKKDFVERLGPEYLERVKESNSS